MSKKTSRNERSEFRFKPEDFKHLYVSFDGGMCTTIDECDCVEIAGLCNRKLQEWLDAAPTVYGTLQHESNEPQDFASYKHPVKGYESTHKAKLVCIEEISSPENENE